MRKENKYIGMIVLGILIIIAAVLIMKNYNNYEINSFPELFRQKAIDKLGVIPVEGFDPDLYKGTFRGLIDSDFENTEAIGGKWIFTNNKLEFVKEVQEITSADGVLTDKGILTLINNLEKRLDIEVNTKEDLDKLINLI